MYYYLCFVSEDPDLLLNILLLLVDTLFLLEHWRTQRTLKLRKFSGILETLAGYTGAARNNGQFCTRKTLCLLL